MTDRYAHLTEDQREAIRTVDRSVAVSAAAGSGKTTVLAERCASLICDGPPGQRCGVDELLVVTFTEAAASEMRNRIRRAIQTRLSEQPDDRYLREQLYLIDGAAISTIHSFCGQLIRRWFPQAEIDPQASILDGDEARTLQKEALDECFAELYEAQTETGENFRRLVDALGAGDDREIAQIVLKAQDYMNSLAEPEAWLRRCRRMVSADHEESVITRLDALQTERLRRELTLQIGHHEEMAATIRACWPIASMYADALDDHADRLRSWLELLDNEGAWSEVCTAIIDFDFERARARPRNLSDEDKASYEAAKAICDETKKRFKDRLQSGMCAFTREEYTEGIAHIAPLVNTLVELVQLADMRYREAKTRQAALDFNDLQRKALELLCEKNEITRPSAIARRLQETFRQVLVDEFQDVDPLQAALLSLVSRESAGDQPGNLFTVGDIKQSIYRFRLAEPKLFAERTRHFKEDPDAGRLIPLSANFRSRSAVIDAVNIVFQSLMSEDFGGCDYTEDHQLFAGLAYPDACGTTFDRPAMEVHLLEAVTEATRPDSDEGQEEDEAPADEEELLGIEREAHLIGSHIRAWMGLDGGEPIHVADRSPTGNLVYRPIRYKDIVILLRALPHKSQPIADVLRRMQIPVIVGREEGGFDTTECRDVIELLRLLDNPQQDIPLAAVLRSAILGDPFNESDLLNIRLHDRECPFHAAATAYADAGEDQTLRDRVKIFLGKLARYRERSRQLSVPDLVWSICEDHHYHSFVAGLPDGLKRRDNLFRLHDLARRAGAFIEPTLHRFLKYLDDLLERGDAPSSSGTPGGHEDVVRVMTVHNSKGLEFPVVILADAGKQFNLTDSRGMVLIDRTWGIAMRAVDPQRRVAYPTLLHQLAAENARREDLSEELRLLYVALTRAREHLMIVGRVSSKRFHAYQRPAPAEGARRVDPMELETASHILDWLMAALRTAPEQQGRWISPEHPASKALIHLHAYERAATDAWQLPPRTQPERSEQLGRLALGAPLGNDEPATNRDTDVRNVLNVIDHIYPYTELTTFPARASVTELEKWERGHEREGDVRLASFHVSARRVEPIALPAFLSQDEEAPGIRRGTLTHRFLQWIDPDAEGDEAGLRTQLDTLIESGRLTADDAEQIDLEAVAWFFTTDLGRRMRRQSAGLRREIAFAARIPPDRYDPSVTSADLRDTILLRGVVDAVLISEQSLEIIDYKTDRIASDQVAARAESYRPQLAAYLEAISTAFKRPAGTGWLVFLEPREIVRIDGREM